MKLQMKYVSKRSQHLWRGGGLRTEREKDIMHEKQKPEEQEWRGAQGLKTCSGLRWMQGMAVPSDSRTCIIVTHTHTGVHTNTHTQEKKKGTSHDVKYIKSFLIVEGQREGEKKGRTEMENGEERCCGMYAHVSDIHHARGRRQ